MTLYHISISLATGRFWSWFLHKKTVVPVSLLHGCQGWPQIGSDWHQMGQIWDLLEQKVVITKSEIGMKSVKIVMF